jgi:signal transduction histidine kinase
MCRRSEFNNKKQKYKFFLFAFLSFFLILFSIFAGFVFFTYQVFFTSLILWRGLKKNFRLSPILDLLAEGLQDITQCIGLPINLIYFLALPFLYLFQALSSQNISLSSVSVTCSGSQAPIELLINC